MSKQNTISPLPQYKVGDHTAHPLRSLQDVKIISAQNPEKHLKGVGSLLLPSASK